MIADGCSSKAPQAVEIRYYTFSYGFMYKIDIYIYYLEVAGHDCGTYHEGPIFLGVSGDADSPGMIPVRTIFEFGLFWTNFSKN